jgi:hypothetical protein
MSQVEANRKRREAQLFGFDAYDVEDRGYGTPCWIYRKKPTERGYCQMRMPDGSQPTAHRAFYMELVGPIPDGLTIDHLCKVRNCVNPDHLEPVSRGENTLRGNSPHAQNARKTHCLNGHLYDEQNTYITPRGERACRACHRMWKALRRRGGVA